VGEPLRPPAPLAAGKPDQIVEIPTLERAALIYRLSGDWNPLHADPKVARQAGFDRPILHGLCTYGIACRAILRTYCDDEPARLSSMFARFTAPVFPGETIRVEFYEGNEQIRFRAVVKERGITVLDRCHVTLAR
jgi:acyl dehydratase